MWRLLTYLIKNKVVTSKAIPELLDGEASGFPKATDVPCASECSACAESCPTQAIEITSEKFVVVDRGACIACRECIRICPSGTLVNDPSVASYGFTRKDLLSPAPARQIDSPSSSMFSNSLAIRVVSTGCSACDLELAAASNPIFDMERFGIHVVASPRFADALVITGPVPKSMHEPLLSCYAAMSDPKLVIALGSCAISGGVHKHGYAEANGVTSLLPVDIFIPGCPPHPWQIISGLLAARRLSGKTRNELPG